MKMITAARPDNATSARRKAKAAAAPAVSGLGHEPATGTPPQLRQDVSFPPQTSYLVAGQVRVGGSPSRSTPQMSTTRVQVEQLSPRQFEHIFPSPQIHHSQDKMIVAVAMRETNR
ncbi:MAG: hypothetical protein ACAH17_03370 [Candidatus Paceibacterota bacterium]